MSDIRELDPAGYLQQLAIFLGSVVREPPTPEALHATLTTRRAQIEEDDHASLAFAQHRGFTTIAISSAQHSIFSDS